MHICYSIFKSAIQVDSVNNFSVSYRKNTTSESQMSYTDTLQPPADVNRAVPTAPVHWLRFSNR
jgi:hypothetical protein